MGKQGKVLNTTRGAAIYSSGMRRKKKKTSRAETKKRNREIEAHLTVAIRRQDYSIALTKCFQNTVKLRERRNKGGG